MVNRNDEPVFNLSAISWRQSKAGTLREMRRRVAFQTNDMAMLEQVFSEQEAELAMVLVSVPQAWLIEGAPASLDWKDPASLNWLQADKMQAIYDALADARNPKA